MHYCQIMCKKFFASIKVVRFLILITVLFLLSYSPAQAVSLSLYPQTQTVMVGQDFTVQVLLDAEDKALLSADVKLVFDPSVLEVSTIRDGAYLSKHLHYHEGNAVYVSGGNAFDEIKGSGTLATIIFKGKGFGVSGVTISCDRKSRAAFTSIKNELGWELIDCSRITNGVYTVNALIDLANPQAFQDGAIHTLSPTPTSWLRRFNAPKSIYEAPTPTGTVRGAFTVEKRTNPPSPLPSFVHILTLGGIILLVISGIIFAFAFIL